MFEYVIDMFTKEYSFDHSSTVDEEVCHRCELSKFRLDSSPSKHSPMPAILLGISSFGFVLCATLC